MTTIFAPCPTYPGYEASVCGVIRRAHKTRITKLCKIVDMPAKIVKPIAARPNFVALPTGWAKITDMVADAWPQYDADELDAMGRPRSWYPDGVVRTVAKVNVRRQALR